MLTEPQERTFLPGLALFGTWRPRHLAVWTAMWLFCVVNSCT